MGILFLEKPVEQRVNGEINLNLSNVNKGVYICRLETDKGIITRKIIKQ